MLLKWKNNYPITISIIVIFVTLISALWMNANRPNDSPICRNVRILWMLRKDIVIDGWHDAAVSSLHSGFGYLLSALVKDCLNFTWKAGLSGIHFLILRFKVKASVLIVCFIYGFSQGRSLDLPPWNHRAECRVIKYYSTMISILLYLVTWAYVVAGLFVTASSFQRYFRVVFLYGWLFVLTYSGWRLEPYLIRKFRYRGTIPHSHTPTLPHSHSHTPTYASPCHPLHIALLGTLEISNFVGFFFYGRSDDNCACMYAGPLSTTR